MDLPKDDARAAFPDASTLGKTNVDVAAGFEWLAAGVITNAESTGASNKYASVSKDYDLIYWDAPTFRESTNNVWNLLGTVRSNWFADDGGVARKRGDIRFYRASYKDRWQKTREVVISNQTVVVAQRPLASEEIYAVHNVVLSAGQNFVSLHGVPYTNTFQGVFGGMENFPGSNIVMSATRIEFFSAGTNAVLSHFYWLSNTNRWIQQNTGVDVTETLMPNDFFSRGFSITLPDPLPEDYVITNACSDFTRTSSVPAMVWSAIAQVPTNAAGFSQVIHCGNRRNPVAPMYNVAALRLPVAAHPSQMKLLDCGFTRGARGTGDEIYTLNPTTKGVLSGSPIYCDSSNVWRFVSGGLVPGGYFRPNDMIVIVSKNGGVGSTWTWSYAPTDFYPQLPTRWMGWTTTPTLP